MAVPAPADPDSSGSATQRALPRVGDYQLLQELGRGAMGAVYRARDQRSGASVAVKLILDPHAGVEDLKRFRREAEAVRGLSHPNLVGLLDVGVDRGRPYLAMELVKGRSLQDQIDASGPLQPAAAAEVVAAVADALALILARGLVHRDLKPDNVLVADEGRPLLADFGLVKPSRELAQSLTESGIALGTPSYMAPEQAQGSRDLDPRCDVYGLGGVLYTCLTGALPFGGESVIDIFRQVVDEPPRPPSELRRGLPRELERICLRCLAKAPDRRYPDAPALAQALREFLAGPPAGSRASAKGVADSPFSWLAAGLVVVALGAAAAILSVSPGRAPGTGPSATRSLTARAPSPTPSPSPAPELKPDPLRDRAAGLAEAGRVANAVRLRRLELEPALARLGELAEAHPGVSGIHALHARVLACGHRRRAAWEALRRAAETAEQESFHAAVTRRGLEQLEQLEGRRIPSELAPVRWANALRDHWRFEDAAALLQRVETPTSQWQVSFTLGGSLRDIPGRRAEAIAAYQRSIQAWRRQGVPGPATWPRVRLAETHLWEEPGVDDCLRALEVVAPLRNYPRNDVRSVREEVDRVVAWSLNKLGRHDEAYLAAKDAVFRGEHLALNHVLEALGEARRWTDLVAELERARAAGWRLPRTASEWERQALEALQRGPR